MNNPFLLLMFAMTLLSSVSQVLLKQSADAEHGSFLNEYLNWRVITAYGIFFLVLLVNTYAYTKVDLKYGSIIDSFTYIFVLLFSRFIFHEKITRKKLAGNLLILAGIIIYTL